MPTEPQTIARTGERFAGFGPYVASIDDAGHVAFWARLAGGAGDKDGVYVWRDGDLAPVDLGGVSAVVSHPDLDGEQVCAYAEVEVAGRRDVVLVLGDRVVAAGDVGPLGPTMNGRGVIAYRAAGGVHLAGPDGARAIATAGDRVAGFEGLPCAGDDGSVVFRANLAGGGHGIYRWTAGDGVAALAETGGVLAELGRFPAPGPDGGAVFAAVDRDGRHGVWVVERGDGSSLRPLEAAAGFASVRGALWCPRGFVFYATERGAEMAIYTDSRRVIGIGDDLDGAAITAFVLNPVSINERGELAVRLELDGGSEAIVKLAPW